MEDLTSDLYKEFLTMEDESRKRSRFTFRCKYEEIATLIPADLELLSTALIDLQIIRELYEDSVLNLVNLKPPILDLDELMLSVNMLLKGLQRQSDLQEKFCKICEQYLNIESSRKVRHDTPDLDSDLQNVKIESSKDDTNKMKDKMDDTDTEQQGYADTVDANMLPVDSEYVFENCGTVNPQDCVEASVVLTKSVSNSLELQRINVLKPKTDVGNVSGNQNLLIKVEVDQNQNCDKKQFSCDQCSRTYKFSTSFKKHIKTHGTRKSATKMHSCDQCNQSFTSKLALKSHVKSHFSTIGKEHSILKQFECDLCCKEFTTSNALNTHMRKHTGEKPFSCEHCAKSFFHKGHLKDHLHVHSGEKPYKCDHCSMSFARMRSKMTHMANHLEDKPFKCQLCNKGFGIKRVLTKHMRCHTGEKNFTCDVCNKSFVSNFVLKVHMRKHTGERPYKCDQCFKMFTQNSSLKDHMRTHTGEKPFKCDQCIKEFSTKSILRKHLLSHASKL